ncbi:unnamed protein product [Taenia asiatica]|uniref:histone acetyltransferase n=1 Tax=Taenia asiatica TaxID=60517 RepID=A0A0R3WC38_TAEAS|nr:unnamed protein product [Taenia asiatica]
MQREAGATSKHQPLLFPSPLIAIPISSCPNSHRDAEAQRWRIIQYHLRLLLHAQYCRQRRLERSIHCNNPHCRIMQNVLRHLEECTAERNCPMQHCFSSRRIIKHWKNCISAECPLCGDLLRERQRGGLPSWRQ